jgi:hypothetical protein
MYNYFLYIQRPNSIETDLGEWQNQINVGIQKSNFFINKKDKNI